jgi:hypothetical protein
MAFLALLALSACGTNPPVRTQTVREKPPAELIADCPVPVIDVRTNGLLAQTLMAYSGALILCNQDKADLRKWAEQ